MSFALWLPDVLTDAGLRVRSYSGWQSRGKSDFTPQGYMWHHTVTSPSLPDVSLDRLLAERGNSSTPPPLCNISTKRDGSITVIAAGTANHGGVGDWKGISGNRYFVGDEMANLGTQASEPWSPIQLESARRAAAAIIDYVQTISVDMFCGHKEYAKPLGRKSDPHTLTMSVERSTVALIIKGGYDRMIQELTEGLKADPRRIDKLVADKVIVGDNAAAYWRGKLANTADPEWRNFWSQVFVETAIRAGGTSSAVPLTVTLKGTATP